MKPHSTFSLEELESISEERVSWKGSDLVVRAYWTAKEPPRELVTSVWAIICTERELLVLTNPDGKHITPGGRIEKDETYEEALRRELIEEAGQAIDEIVYLGFIHLHHTTPRPENYAYPYPDFFWLVYRARPGGPLKGSNDPDGYERDAKFLPFDEVRRLDLSAADIAFLDSITDEFDAPSGM